MTTIETENGTYCILSAPSGKLHDRALQRFYEAARHGDELIYADHTVRFEDGQSKLVRKPDWSPDTLLSTNYMESPIAVLDRFLPEGAEEAFLSAEGRYALTLLLTERTHRIAHLHESLFRCEAEQPCASVIPLKNALSRRHIQARVERGELPGSYRVRYPVPVKTRVSCIVYGNGAVRQFRNTLESIATQCCWPHVELIVADNGYIETEKERYYAALRQNRAAKIVRSQDMGITQLLNRAACISTGEALLLLPAGMQLSAFDTMESMLELALQKHVGAVGGAVAESRPDANGIIHNVRALDGPMMAEKNRFLKAGGFDETFAEGGFVRAYTLLNGARRLYNVVTPYASFSDRRNREQTALSESNKQRIQDMRCFEDEPCGKA